MQQRILLVVENQSSGSAFGRRRRPIGEPNGESYSLGVHPSSPTFATTARLHLLLCWQTSCCLLIHEEASIRPIHDALILPLGFSSVFLKARAATTIPDADYVQQPPFFMALCCLNIHRDSMHCGISGTFRGHVEIASSTGQ